MKKLYNEYFRVTEHEKIRDKVMIARVALTVVIVLVCLAGMSLTAYAYFSHSVSSAQNSIKAATFTVDTTITVSESDTNSPVEVIKSGGVEPYAELKAGKTYNVTLAYGAGSTSQTGFCAITALGNINEYHSQQLGADKLAIATNGRTESITFTLTVTHDTKVIFTARWGTSVYYTLYEANQNPDLYITNGEAINIQIDPSLIPSENSEDETEKPTDTNTDTPQNNEDENVNNVDEEANNEETTPQDDALDDTNNQNTEQPLDDLKTEELVDETVIE